MSQETIDPKDINGRMRMAPTLDFLSAVPWWLIILILLGLVATYNILTDDQMGTIFLRIGAGIRVTVTVTIFAYLLAITIGLFVGLGRVSKNIVANNFASLYVRSIAVFSGSLRWHTVSPISPPPRFACILYRFSLTPALTPAWRRSPAVQLG
jgi:hypothetical protein